MKTVYKYPLNAEVTSHILTHGNVLSAGVQGDDIVVWAVHDDDEPVREFRINVVGTGHDWPDGLNEANFLNTVFMDWMVFHVFATELT